MAAQTWAPKEMLVEKNGFLHLESTQPESTRPRSSSDAGMKLLHVGVESESDWWSGPWGKSRGLCPLGRGMTRLQPPGQKTELRKHVEAEMCKGMEMRSSAASSNGTTCVYPAGAYPGPDRSPERTPCSPSASPDGTPPASPRSVKPRRVSATSGMFSDAEDEETPRCDTPSHVDGVWSRFNIGETANGRCDDFSKVSKMQVNKIRRKVKPAQAPAPAPEQRFLVQAVPLEASTQASAGAASGYPGPPPGMQASAGSGFGSDASGFTSPRQIAGPATLEQAQQNFTVVPESQFMVQALPLQSCGHLQQGPQGTSFMGPQGQSMMMMPAWVGFAADGTTQPIVVMQQAEERTELTLMLRNIPNKYRPDMLLDNFFEWRQFIDFYYMPIDFKNCGNLGYAFVNFHNVDAARAFRAAYDGHRLPLFQESNKVLAVSEARVQGQHSNTERFRNSSVMGVLQEQFRPMIFDKAGRPLEFPKPDGAIPATGPRFRRPR